MIKNVIKNENRLSTLEANYISLEEKITEIKDNHLVHLADDISKLKDKISAIDVKLAMWSGAIIVAGYILQTFFK